MSIKSGTIHPFKLKCEEGAQKTMTNYDLQTLADFFQDNDDLHIEFKDLVIEYQNRDFVIGRTRSDSFVVHLSPSKSATTVAAANRKFDVEYSWSIGQGELNGSINDDQFTTPILLNQALGDTVRLWADGHLTVELLNFGEPSLANVEATVITTFLRGNKTVEVSQCLSFELTGLDSDTSDIEICLSEKPSQ